MTWEPTEAYIVTCNGRGCVAEYKDPHDECVIFFTAEGRKSERAEGAHDVDSGNEPAEPDNGVAWLFVEDCHWCPDCRVEVDRERVERAEQAAEAADAQQAMTPLFGASGGA